MKELIIVAGPNGAGKTSFANKYLPAAREALVFVNADEIARGLSVDESMSTQRDVAAGRQMLDEIDRLASLGIEFMLETTLATLIYATRIPRWQQQGYWVSLIYLKLPSADASVERVRRRVQAGGHAISEDVVRRRFEKSVKYLERIYKPLVDDWSVWDSLEGDFRVIATSDD